MKFGVKDCLNFKLFDDEGNKIYTLDYACKSRLDILRSKGMCILGINHELNDFELMSLMNSDGDRKSDFENELGDIEIDFGIKLNENKYKAIGEFLIKMEDGQDKKVKLIFDNVVFCDEDSRDNRLEFNSDKVNSFNTIFKILPNKYGKFFKMKAVI